MRHGPYHPTLYDAEQAAPSYWEASAPPPQDGFQPLAGAESCEVAVIGGGFTGLSAALHLARDHSVDVRVLDAGHIGWGASGRNGGFCCLAATKLSVAQLIKRYGLEETKAFYQAQRDGIELVETLGRDEAIDFDRQGEGIFEVAHRPAATAGLRAEAETLERLFGIPTQTFSKEQFAEIGHDSREQFGALHVGAGFGLHPLKFLAGLAQAAARRGARLHPRSRVIDWVREDGRHRLVSAGGSLSARRVILATNGYTPEGLHPDFKGRTLPAISNIITTRPLSDDELAAQSWKTETPICNTRNLLFYYRLLKDRRILFGARGDFTGRPADGEKMRAWLERRFSELFPAWREIETTHYWRGLICLSRKLSPSIGHLEDEPTVSYAFGYHGNGVNTTPWAGRALAREIAGANRSEVPAVMAGLPPRIPFAALRLWGLRAACLYYRVKDDFI